MICNVDYGGLMTIDADDKEYILSRLYAVMVDDAEFPIGLDKKKKLSDAIQYFKMMCKSSAVAEDSVYPQKKLEEKQVKGV